MRGLGTIARKAAWSRPTTGLQDKWQGRRAAVMRAPDQHIPPSRPGRARQQRTRRWRGRCRAAPRIVPPGCRLPPGKIPQQGSRDAAEVTSGASFPALRRHSRGEKGVPFFGTRLLAARQHGTRNGPRNCPPFFSPGAFFPRSVAPCLKEPGAGSKATQRIRGERFSRLPRRSAHQHGRDTAAPLSCWRHASRGREGCRGPERWPVGPVQGRARGHAARSAALVSEETVASRRMLQSLLRHKRGPAIPACRGAARRAPRRPRPGVAPTEGRARGSELQDAPRGSRRGLDAVRPPH